jgi:hypothetical protein
VDLPDVALGTSTVAGFASATAGVTHDPIVATRPTKLIHGMCRPHGRVSQSVARLEHSSHKPRCEPESKEHADAGRQPDDRYRRNRAYDSGRQIDTRRCGEPTRHGCPGPAPRPSNRPWDETGDTNAEPRSEKGCPSGKRQHVDGCRHLKGIGTARPLLEACLADSAAETKAVAEALG